MRRFDKMWCGDAQGRLVELFDPPWWRAVDRGLLFLWRKYVRKMPVGVVKLWSDEGERLVRAIVLKDAPKKVS